MEGGQVHSQLCRNQARRQGVSSGEVYKFLLCTHMHVCVCVLMLHTSLRIEIFYGSHELLQFILPL